MEVKLQKHARRKTQMKRGPASTLACLWMAKKHNVSDMVMHVTAEVTASKTAKNRCSRRPQSVLTNKPKPFTTVASAVAIFSLATKHKEATTPRKSFKPTLYQIRRSLLSFKFGKWLRIYICVPCYMMSWWRKCTLKKRVKKEVIDYTHKKKKKSWYNLIR
jgi:hypothetical protein